MPRWIVVGAGTGGTSATIGRYVRFRRLATQVCLVDPDGSVYAEAWANRDRTLRSIAAAGRIEGIGRHQVEESFLPDVIDRAERVPDAASIAGLRLADRLLGRRVGASTGTNVWGVLSLVAELRAAGERGSIVTLLCDGGDRYAHTVYDDAWLAAQGLDPGPYETAIDAFLGTGAWAPPD